MNRIEDAMLDVGRAMREFTAPFITQLFEVESTQRGHFLGSGTFARLGTDVYLLTAAHVPQSAHVRRWAHSAGDGVPPALVPNAWQCRSFPSDLALVRLDGSYFDGSFRVRALGPEFFAESVPELAGDFLFVHGWPGERSKELWCIAQGIASTTLPYTTVVGASSRGWFRPDVHFAIEYRFDNQRDESGRIARVPHPGGLSGAAVWKTNWRDNRNRWTPDCARVVGVAFDWDTDGNNLTCTRIDAVRDFINESLRREAAYFRWLERGCPGNDDWADWYCVTPFAL